MNKPLLALLGAIVVIIGLSLLFAVNVASRSAPPVVPPHVTGPQDSCNTNADCWCAAFDGAEFIAGEFSAGTCTETKTCALCIYE